MIMMMMAMMVVDVLKKIAERGGVEHRILVNIFHRVNGYGTAEKRRLRAPKGNGKRLWLLVGVRRPAFCQQEESGKPIESRSSSSVDDDDDDGGSAAAGAYAVERCCREVVVLKGLKRCLVIIFSDYFEGPGVLRE